MLRSGLKSGVVDYLNYPPPAILTVLYSSSIIFSLHEQGFEGHIARTNTSHDKE